MVLWFSNCPLLGLLMETIKGPVLILELVGGGGDHGGFFRNLMILNKPDNPTIFKSVGPTLSALLKAKAVPGGLGITYIKNTNKSKNTATN